MYCLVYVFMLNVLPGVLLHPQGPLLGVLLQSTACCTYGFMYKVLRGVLDLPPVYRTAPRTEAIGYASSSLLVGGPLLCSSTMS